MLNAIFSIEITDEFDHVASYSAGVNGSIQTGNETTVANIFHDSGTLKAVGTVTNGRNQKITIKICDENMENAIYTQDAVFEYPGYHTVILDEEIEVTDYSIVIIFEGEAPVEGASWDDININYTVTASEGESFVLVNNEWIDLVNSDDVNVRKVA